ncbi:MAG: helix-turn-helix transcriptional regulator [Erysipelotrichaceae bacterium]|nr:helix-turn-helix transcriptional regulator [Erysipelotrichaceae bacterium]
MKQKPIEEMTCPLSATLSVLEGKYKIYIIFYLIGRTLRYSQLQKLIPDATPKMLSQQLKALEEQGIINRKLYPVVPPRTDYSLTEKGQSLVPIIFAMYQWGEEIFRENGKEDYCSLDEIKRMIDAAKLSESPVHQ